MSDTYLRANICCPITITINNTNNCNIPKGQDCVHVPDTREFLINTKFPKPLLSLKSAIWEKFPNNPGNFFLQAYLSHCLV